MDPFQAPFTVGADMGLAFYLASGIVLLVNLIKAAFYHWAPSRWQEAVSVWWWVAVGAVVSIGLCVWFNIDIVGRLLGGQNPFSGTASNVASGVALAVSSNVLYKLAVKPEAKAKANIAVAAAVAALNCSYCGRDLTGVSDLTCPSCAARLEARTPVVSSEKPVGASPAVPGVNLPTEPQDGVVTVPCKTSVRLLTTVPLPDPLGAERYVLVTRDGVTEVVPIK